MPPLTATIEYTDGETKIEIVVRRANAVMGMERSILIVRGEEKAKNFPREAQRALLIRTYPDLMGCTESITGLPYPLPFEEFCEIPDDLLLQWEHAAYEVNPHWAPYGQPAEEEQKKA